MEYPAGATFYVRLSLMIPREGMLDGVLELHHQLVDWLHGQPGFIRGLVITSGDAEGRVGHLTVYDSAEDADHAAQTQHVLAVRSELLHLIEEDSHVERSWVAHDPQLAKAPSS